MTRLFEREFPDYPAADMPAIPAGFEDTSWHNDACPSFTSDQLGLTIWIDFLDPAKREFESKYPRFNINHQDHGVEVGTEGLMTDDWNAVLAYVANVAAKLEA